jgi:hypothetical protein
MKKCQNMFGSAKWLLPSNFAQFAEATKRHIKAVRVQEKSVINMI